MPDLWVSPNIATICPPLTPSAEDQQGWGNVRYIPAAPWCPRNERYAVAVREAFQAGTSPTDFPAEHYESDWPNRFQPDELNPTGRRGLGLD
ncbi:YbiU family protein [Micromonospora vulcania]|uniref:YbiU family protein n=1 Tax=Micromonospora vulcania TaxID=1441873 RepID=A0ABW1H2J2_9ACTN